MILVEVKLEDKNWQEGNKLIVQKLKSLIKKIIPQTPLKLMIKKNIDIEISLVLTNNNSIRKLNKKYRNQNKATNVLSFPVIDYDLIKNGNLKKINPVNNYLILGDIVLAIETIKKESSQQNKNFWDHLTHLLIHGLLHLIGYDHERNLQDAEIMENLEIKLLKNLDITNPYNI